MENSNKFKRKGNYRATGNTIHGLFNKHKDLFKTWQNIKTRCTNKKRHNYDRYGGRGIDLCAEWYIAINFVKWALKSGYKKGLQIDRIDNSRGYSPDNCRWVTAKQNSQNTRRNVFLTIDNRTECVSEWSRIKNISQYTIHWWIKEKGKEYAEKRLSEVA